MKPFLAAVAFLTRIPVPSRAVIGPGDVGRAAKWFPLVGLFLGAAAVGMLCALTPLFPVDVAAVLVVLAEALLTGALHMDGLADMADGFGGGRDREHTLAIMRDHAVGSYGTVAVVLLIALKVTAIGALVARPHWWVYLLLAPMLGRWATLPLMRFVPYARGSSSIIDNMHTAELVWGSAAAAVACVAVGRLSGLICWAAVLLATLAFGRYCKRKIGGITGDTLGANVQICECIVLLAGLAFSESSARLWVARFPELYGPWLP